MQDLIERTEKAREKLIKFMDKCIQPNCGVCDVATKQYCSGLHAELQHLREQLKEKCPHDRAKCPYCGYMNVITSHHSIGYFTALGRYVSPTSQGVTARTCRHFWAVELDNHVTFKQK